MYTDSAEALQEFTPNSYDLVILDVRIPKLDGFALCKKIREVDRDVQIIFITAGEAHYENFRKQYYPEISNDININCLRKPIINEELVQIVNMTMARKEAKDTRCFNVTSIFCTQNFSAVKTARTTMVSFLVITICSWPF